MAIYIAALCRIPPTASDAGSTPTDWAVPETGTPSGRLETVPYIDAP